MNKMLMIVVAALACAALNGRAAFLTPYHISVTAYASGGSTGYSETYGDPATSTGDGGVEAYAIANQSTSNIDGTLSYSSYTTDSTASFQLFVVGASTFTLAVPTTIYLTLETNFTVAGPTYGTFIANDLGATLYSSNITDTNTRIASVDLAAGYYEIQSTLNFSSQTYTTGPTSQSASTHISTVPEPATIALLIGAGAMILAGKVGRKRRPILKRN